MTRPCQPLVATALCRVAILRCDGGGIVSAELRGRKIVVTVTRTSRLLRRIDSRLHSTRSHPDIEVRTNLVGLLTLLKPCAPTYGGSADDIFISNAYFGRRADSGRLMTDAADWEPAVVDQFTWSGVLWGAATDGCRKLLCSTTPICRLPPVSTLYAGGQLAMESRR